MELGECVTHNIWVDQHHNTNISQFAKGKDISWADCLSNSSMVPTTSVQTPPQKSVSRRLRPSHVLILVAGFLFSFFAHVMREPGSAEVQQDIEHLKWVFDVCVHYRRSTLASWISAPPVVIPFRRLRCLSRAKESMKEAKLPGRSWWSGARFEVDTAGAGAVVEAV